MATVKRRLQLIWLMTAQFPISNVYLFFCSFIQLPNLHQIWLIMQTLQPLAGRFWWMGNSATNCATIIKFKEIVQKLIRSTQYQANRTTTRLLNHPLEQKFFSSRWRAPESLFTTGRATSQPAGQFLTGGRHCPASSRVSLPKASTLRSIITSPWFRTCCRHRLRSCNRTVQSSHCPAIHGISTLTIPFQRRLLVRSLASTTTTFSKTSRQARFTATSCRKRRELQSRVIRSWQRSREMRWSRFWKVIISCCISSTSTSGDWLTRAD